MFGKGALIFVLGMGMIFSSFQLTINRAVATTVDSFNRYYMKSLVHETAVSAMNMGINKVWSENWQSGSFDIELNGCMATVTASPVGLDTVRIKAKASGNMFDIENSDKSNHTLAVFDSVIASFSYVKPVSRYFWFTKNENGVHWITGDSVWGPIHTNGTLLTSGTPVFFDKVTARGGIDPNPGESTAVFHGGWEIGVDNEIPTDMTPLVNAAKDGNDGAPMNSKSLYDQELALEFMANGQVVRTVDGSVPDTVLLSHIAPTGVLYSSKDIRIKGALNGRVTLYSDKNIWIDDNIVYADDPNFNLNSDDILGLVAKNKVYITDNLSNNNDVHIQAAILAINGEFTAENHNSRPQAGTLHLTGSVVQKNRGAVGLFTGPGNISNGFSKRYHYDARFNSSSPPYYPYVRSLHLTSWWE